MVDARPLIVDMGCIAPSELVVSGDSSRSIPLLKNALDVLVTPWNMEFSLPGNQRFPPAPYPFPPSLGCLDPYKSPRVFLVSSLLPPNLCGNDIVWFPVWQEFNPYSSTSLDFPACLINVYGFFIPPPLLSSSRSSTRPFFWHF